MGPMLMLGVCRSICVGSRGDVRPWVGASMSIGNTGGVQAWLGSQVQPQVPLNRHAHVKRTYSYSHKHTFSERYSNRYAFVLG